MKSKPPKNMPHFGEPPAPDSVPRPWQPKFGVGFMLLLMLMMTVVSAAGYYLVQALYGGREQKLMFILFTLVSPIVAVIVISIGYHVFKLITRSS